MFSFPHGIFICPKYGIIQYKILEDFITATVKNKSQLIDLTFKLAKVKKLIKLQGN